MNSGNRRRRGKQCFAIAAIMLLLTGCAAGGASESSAAEETGVISTYEEEQKEPSGGGNTTAPLSQSESVFDLEKRTVLLNSGYEMPVIGLGTWTLSDDEVLSFATITPAVIQNENHLYYQNTDLQDYVRQYNIVIESWYPFGGRGHTSEHFGNEVITELADKYGKSSAQIILRWQLQAGFVAIPGASDPLTQP